MGAQESWSPGSPLSGTSKIPPSWGGEAILSQLRLYAHIVRSQIEPQLFLVNPSRDDLEVHSTALFEDEAVPTEAMFGLGLAREGLPSGVRDAREGKRTSILHQSLEGNGYPDVVSPAMDNFTFNVLNSFSRITRGSVFVSLGDHRMSERTADLNSSQSPHGRSERSTVRHGAPARQADTQDHSRTEDSPHERERRAHEAPGERRRRCACSSGFQTRA